MKSKKVRKTTLFFKLFIFIVICIGIGYLALFKPTNNIEEYNADNLSIQHNFLTVNPYSRSGDSLKRVKGIVVHYTANPGSSAINNRDYFESLKVKKTAMASSHFIVGLKGEVIQCIPLKEISYASNNRNKDTISIETCHPDASGKFNDKTYKALQSLVQSLMKTYNLDKDNVIRHYDVTGKECPKYFVDNPSEWKKFLNSL